MSLLTLLDPALDDAGFDITEVDPNVASLDGDTLQQILSWAGIGADNASGILGGISGAQAGTGLTALLGTLGALTKKPSVGSANQTSTRSGEQTTTVGTPEWYKQLTENLGTSISGDDKSWSDLAGMMTKGTSSATDLAPADFDKYMNPYVANVLTPQLARMDEDFARSQNQRDAEAISKGAFGGSRLSLEQNLAGERFDKTKAEATNNAMMQAYQNAMTQFGTDRTANQWGVDATNKLFASLKPNTTTSVGTTVGDTQKTTTATTGSNIFGDLSNIAGGTTQTLFPNG